MSFIPDAVVDHLLGVGGELDLSGTKYCYRGDVGEGGMGAVYAVEDIELGREVALKVVSGAHAQRLAERLRNEARVLARLEHPGIVPVHDIGCLADGRSFYVMKLVRGERLDRWAEAAPLPAMLRLFQRICEAVAYAHAHGVIHRDLKPENIMVGPFGEALVMDWGIAKQLGEAAASARSEPAVGPEVGGADTTLDPQYDDTQYDDTQYDDTQYDDTVTAIEAATAEGTVMGTPAFMAPEQARGEIDALDQRSDVYALGAILYTLLASRPPFAGDSAREVVRQVIDGEPEPLLAVDPGIARPLASICARAMAKRPADRYSTALELADDIGRYLDRLPTRAHRETLFELAARFASRHRVLLTLLGVYLLVRVALAVFVPG
jgi:serine/threonine protein kinase